MPYHLGRYFDSGLSNGPIVVCPYCDVSIKPGLTHCSICGFAPPPAPKPRNCVRCQRRWQPENARQQVCDRH